MTIESITLGCFSALSTGYWSRLSEKRGRPNILLIVYLGLGLSELIFILVKVFKLPVNLLLIGSLVEGILGGPATLNTLITGYVHDHLSQHQLSTATGLMLSAGAAMVGSAIGPSFANWLIAFSEAQLLAPSYAILVCLPPLALVTRFLLPHKKPSVSMDFSRDSQPQRKSVLAPLHVLRPVRGDRSLLLLAISYGLYCFVGGSSTVKLQYAASEFDWDAVKIGEYLTILGSSRVASLLIVIPLILYVWNRKANHDPVKPSSVDGSDLLEGQNVAGDFHYASMDLNFSNLSPQSKPTAVVFGCPSTNTSRSSLTLCPSEVVLEVNEDDTRWKTSATKDQELELNSSISQKSYQTQIDLNLTRFSIGWGMICGVCLLFSHSMLSFIVPSALEALSRSTGPAIQAVALSLIAIKRDNIGSADVISSFSLIGILAYDLFGPLLFGAVYVTSRSQELSKCFLFVIVALEIINLTVISFVDISEKKAVDEEFYCSEGGQVLLPNN
ncbi:hypothetical protein PGTUg99_018037 [Puccinia graminis f. sp. tritici]|uniref:Major facilitator superfamily (MFS) profile domain-containing protein n=1 Tax=Puccinia graminis f. sp. tritici TaxID=56615 RepID=A0A5B0RFR6_PUCGR|nr:hypothetical protein PGTUg99_018037 [Puccinia graminis f. sp. tritici]